MELNVTELAEPIRNVTSILDDGSISRDDMLYDVPVGIVILLSIFYGSISIIAVIGNSLVIWIVATTRQMQTVTNLFIANLALADVVIGMFAIPFQFQAALLQRWDLPDFMCGFCPFVQTVSVNVSVFTLTAIAVDRHRAIINPLRARPPKYISKIIITFIWVISLLFSIPMAIALRVIPQEGYKFNNDNTITIVEYKFCDVVNLKTEFPQYRYYLVFVQYFIPFGVISFVYIQMAIRLWGSKTPGNAQDTRDVTLMRNKKRVIKMLIIVVLLFGICWFPLQFYNILHVTYEGVNSYKYINIVWFCCDWLAMSNSCYNPFIYGIYNEKFKREFRRRFPFFRLKFEHSDHSEKNVSMYTRASSIRSNYTTSSSKSKFLIPQRIVGGNSSLQHYNALHMTDSTPKNNNIVNAHCGNNHNCNAKSSWLFNQTPTNSSVVEWQDKKNGVCLPKVYYKGCGNSTCSTTMVPPPSSTATTTTSKFFLYEPIDMQMKKLASPQEIGKKSCCCHQLTKNLSKNSLRDNNDIRRMSNTEIEQMHLRGTISPLAEDDADEYDDADEGDEDFRKSIIRINNIYNSCRDVNNGASTDNDKFIFINNTHQPCHRTTNKLETDINL